jgi:DNA-binding MarR family transcriptional regulator
LSNCSIFDLFFSKKRKGNVIFAAMRSYIEIITNWESFLAQSPDGSLEDFAQWLLATSNQQKTRANSTLEGDLQQYFDNNTSEYSYTAANSEAAYLIGRLNKFIKRYTKPLFSDLGITNQDEFAILAHVDYLKESIKKTIIEDNLIDMSSGIDMMNRLLKRKWLIERTNPLDKREKLVSLTPEGKAVLLNIYKGLATIPDILVDMSDAQKNIFVQRLKDLDDFHTKHQ